MRLVREARNFTSNKVQKKCAVLQGSIRRDSERGDRRPHCSCDAANLNGVFSRYLDVEKSSGRGFKIVFSELGQNTRIISKVHEK
jgi:hypothetical protein